MIALLAGLLYFSSPAHAAPFISIADNPTGGDCASFGTWDAAAKTCTITGDIDMTGADGFHIDDNNVTLDGGGHTLTGGLSGDGVYLYGRTGVNVRNLNITGFSIGVYLGGESSGNIIDGNNTSGAAMGIFLSHANGNTITDNNCASGGYGINLSNSSASNTVQRNTVLGNSEGIYVATAGANTFSYNTISSNARGICITSSNGNIFHHNNLLANTTQAAVYGGAGNLFNWLLPNGGNYWSDWTAPDSNSDGFVDSPYTFLGGSDDYPWTTQNGWDTQTPSLYDLYPAGDVHTGSFTIGANVSDGGLSGLDTSSGRVSINGRPAQTCTVDPAGGISCLETSLTMGHYDFVLSVSDNAGHTGIAIGYFDIDAWRISDDPTGGDCTAIGSWDAGTKTCTLLNNLDTYGIDGIYIESDGITVNGNGHWLSGDGTMTGTGITISAHDEVSVRSVWVENFQTGIHVEESRNVTLEALAGHECVTGVYLGDVNGGNLRWVTFDQNQVGLDMSYARNLLLDSNVASQNTNIGVWLHAAADYNTITGNSISGNAHGLTLSGSSHNRILDNNFLGNTEMQAYESGGDHNLFYSELPYGGNYWSDWTTPDANGNGIVDNPYVFTGNSDLYPWASPSGWDTSAPELSHLQPSGMIRTSTVQVTADYEDPLPSAGINAGSVALTITGPDGTITPPCTASGSPGGSISCYALNGQPEGHYEYDLQIADNVGHTDIKHGSFDISPYRISDTAGGGDCSTYLGAWNAATKTCTLGHDVAVGKYIDGIRIESDGITLDGAGHTLSSSPGYTGVLINGRSNVTVRNLTANEFISGGVALYYSTNCEVANNHISSSNPNGVGIKITGGSSNVVEHNLTESNGLMGINIFLSTGNRVTENTCSNNGFAGIGVHTADGNIITANTVTANPYHSIYSYGSSNNIFRGNLVSGNYFGMYVSDSPGSIITRNVFIGNWHWNGLNLYANNCQVYGNSFFGNWPEAINQGTSVGNIFTTPHGGGNYFDDFDSPGEGCTDADHDGFCDAPYTFTGGQDDHPWAADNGWLPEYYWTWYDNVYAANWVLLANPAESAKDLWYDLTIAGDFMQLEALPGHAAGLAPEGHAITPRYTGVIGGPVEVGVHAADEGIVSQRILWAGNSMEEVLGTSAARLSDHYYWTWYDMQSPGFKNWVLVANPNLTDVYYELRIAGQLNASGRIWGGEFVTPQFPGVMGGPVEVQAWTDSGKTAPADVMASQRVLINGDTSFNEVAGIPAVSLATSYVWTWYDDASAAAKNWILVANPKSYTIYYDIKVAGSSVGSGSLAPAGQPGDIFASRFGGMGGPVEVSFWKDSVGGSLITEGIATQRTLWGPSFEEVPGYPVNSLASTYHWTWYDQLSPGMTNWVLVAHQYSETITAEVRFTDSTTGETVTITHDITPAERQWTPTFPGKMGGPVKVRAWLTTDPGQSRDVIVSQRVLYNGFFNEVEGTVLS